MSTTLLTRGTDTTEAAPVTCQAYARSLVVPCPNVATVTVAVRGEQRAVCAAHSLPVPRQR